MKQGSVLELKRLLPAEIGRVFAAWSSADALSRWFMCAPGWTATTSLDFRVGGKFRVEMHSAGRPVGTASGEYREIDPPRRLVFTWTAEGAVGVRDSVVVVELKAIGAQTELTLTHDLAPGTPEGRAHESGWHACLASLERALRRDS